MLKIIVIRSSIHIYTAICIFTIHIYTKHSSKAKISVSNIYMQLQLRFHLLCFDILFNVIPLQSGQRLNKLNLNCKFINCCLFFFFLRLCPVSVIHYFVLSLISKIKKMSRFLPYYMLFFFSDDLVNLVFMWDSRRQLRRVTKCFQLKKKKNHFSILIKRQISLSNPCIIYSNSFQSPHNHVSSLQLPSLRRDTILVIIFIELHSILYEKNTNMVAYRFELYKSGK